MDDNGNLNVDRVWGNDHVAMRIGTKMAKILKMKKQDGFFDTQWGKKTSKGLIRAVLALLEEELEVDKAAKK